MPLNGIVMKMKERAQAAPSLLIHYCYCYCCGVSRGVSFGFFMIA
jgi:hypothetical protein